MVIWQQSHITGSSKASTPVTGSFRVGFFTIRVKFNWEVKDGCKILYFCVSCNNKVETSLVFGVQCVMCFSYVFSQINLMFWTWLTINTCTSSFLHFSAGRCIVGGYWEPYSFNSQFDLNSSVSKVLNVILFFVDNSII